MIIAFDGHANTYEPISPVYAYACRKYKQFKHIPFLKRQKHPYKHLQS
jgi:hypothetical protein